MYPKGDKKLATTPKGMGMKKPNLEIKLPP
jgi:hypothetical protein